jgi:hypothetical protein
VRVTASKDLASSTKLSFALAKTQGINKVIFRVTLPGVYSLLINIDATLNNKAYSKILKIRVISSYSDDCIKMAGEL